LSAAGFPAATALAAIAGVLPAVEIVDSRVADWKIKLVDTVADNASSGLLVLGGTLHRVIDLDLRLLGVVVTRGGQLLDTGAGAAALGNPARCVAWLANKLAPEHCEIMCRNAARVAEKIVTAGAIFLGHYSPTVLGDYVAGPSHELPTGGAGSAFAGLTVDQFQRRTSVVEYQRGALKKSLRTIEVFAAAEGLDAHGRSASIRLA
jgi:hypothetical protein